MNIGSSPTTTHFLIDVLRPYRLVAFLVIVLSFLGSVCDGLSVGILVPLLSHVQQVEATHQLPHAFQWLMSLLHSYPLEQRLYWAILFVICANLFKNFCVLLSIHLGHWLAARVLADLRLRAARLLMTVGVAFHQQSRLGELLAKTISNTSDVEALIRFGIQWLANGLTCLVLISLLFLLSWQLTLITLGLGTFFFGAMHHHTRYIRRLGKAVTTTSQGLLSSMHEALSGIQLIKSYSQEQQQLSRLREKIDVNRKVESRLRFNVFAIHPLTDVSATIAAAGLMIFAMRMYQMDPKLMLTRLLPFLYVLLRLVPLVKLLNMQRGEIISHWSHMSLVQDLLREDNKPRIPDGEKIFSGLQRTLQFHKVTFYYPGHEIPALQEVNFTIPAGKTTAIIGESGSGKSTITALLLRLYDPQQGIILLDGERLPRFQLASFHRRIGVVSQDTFLFNETVKFNIAFGVDGTLSDEEIITAAQKAGAHEFIEMLPEGYNTYIGDRGVTLSGGQRQRLAIARAIVRDPQILLLDEATSALDTQTEQRVREAIVELSRGRTVIIIAHRLSTIKNADQIVVLKQGQVVETGATKQLLAQRGEYYALVQAG